MKLTRLAFCMICLLMLHTTLYSQASLNSDNLSSVKIDDISDSDLKVYYQKAVNSGLSEEQIYKLMLSKGLPDAELDKLKKRVVNFGDGMAVAGAPATGQNSVKVVPGAERTANSDVGTLPMEPFTKIANVFGSELFSSNSMVFEPNLRIATPSNYILGPDDEVIINVFGLSEQTYSVKVSQEGNIYIPNIGPIYVNGLSMEQASIKIKNKLASTIYRAINSGGTRVQITLGKIRSIRVTVIGEARKPGTYTVSSLTTLFNLLYLCGGPSEMGSFRNIELIRGNQLKKTVDIYNFLTRGDLKDNVLLEELDVIRIPFYKTRVMLQGEVKREGRFELQPDETFNQLLSYSGGFTDNAYTASVKVVKITDREKKLIDITSKDFPTYQPAGSDIITVGKLLDRYENRVTVSGAVVRPGEYEMLPNMTLKDLVEKAGGLREDAFLQRGIIFRENADRSPSSVSFGVQDVVNGSQVIQLKKEDQVVIGSKTEMQDNFTVSIEGMVRKPGPYAWKEHLSLKDVIFLAGGFSEAANQGNIEISRRLKNASVTQAEFQQAEVIRVDLKSGLAGDGQDLTLQPFDVIAVRNLSGYLQQKTVAVGGEVITPGTFTLQYNNEKISDLVKRFGGFKNGADTNNVTVRRLVNTTISGQDKKDLFQRLLSVDDDSLRKNTALRNEFNKQYDLISIDLRKAMTEPNSSANLTLEDGDFISIDRASLLIKVGGEVYYPTLLPYQPGANAKFYLKQSGGFTENARKSSAMVVYPDGKARKIGKFLFFRSYPGVTPKSEIFVPSKNKNNRSRLSTGEWLAISSIFATLGTLIITAFK